MVLLLQTYAHEGRSIMMSALKVIIRNGPPPAARVILWTGMLGFFMLVMIFAEVLARKVLTAASGTYPGFLTLEVVVFAAAIVATLQYAVLIQYRFSPATAFGIALFMAVGMAAYELGNPLSSSGLPWQPRLALELLGGVFSFVFFFLGPQDNWQKLNGGAPASQS